MIKIQGWNDLVAQRLMVNLEPCSALGLCPTRDLCVLSLSPNWLSLLYCLSNTVLQE